MDPYSHWSIIHAEIEQHYLDQDAILIPLMEYEDNLLIGFDTAIDPSEYWSMGRSYCYCPHFLQRWEREREPRWLNAFCRLALISVQYIRSCQTDYHVQWVCWWQNINFVIFVMLYARPKSCLKYPLLEGLLIMSSNCSFWERLWLSRNWPKFCRIPASDRKF